MEALSRILTFPTLNQYHMKRYLKVQSFTKCYNYYKEVLHSFSTCNTAGGGGGGWGGATGFDRQVKSFWTELLYKENFPVLKGELSCQWSNLVSKVILTADQFTWCPTLNETSTGDMWLQQEFLTNHYKERDLSYNCKWNNLDLNCHKHKHANVHSSLTFADCSKSHTNFLVPTLHLHTDILVHSFFVVCHIFVGPFRV